MKPKLLDLFCGAGGSAMGYHRAGFEVVGVDIKPQPRYPFEFHCADALEFPLEGYDAYHASPPCQKWSTATAIHGYKHPDLLTPTRERFKGINRPWVIENIETAPMENALMLCGTMFGLKTRRHRLFESNVDIYFAPMSCTCKGKDGYTASKDGQSSFKRGAKLISVTGHNFLVAEGKLALGINWMTQHELSQAIPPAYTEYIGKYLIKALGVMDTTDYGAPNA